MALTARFLADKSALARMRRPAVRDVLAPLILAGQVATCGIVELEVLYSARGHAELVATRAQRRAAYPRVAMSESDFTRAEEVMALLARGGRHRAAGIPDLLLAAAAERGGLVVLHYDADFEIIASVTGQPVEWVVPRGSAG